MKITINEVQFEVGNHCEITIEGEARVTVNHEPYTLLNIRYPDADPSLQRRLPEGWHVPSFG